MVKKNEKRGISGITQSITLFVTVDSVNHCFKLSTMVNCPLIHSLYHLDFRSR